MSQRMSNTSCFAIARTIISDRSCFALAQVLITAAFNLATHLTWLSYSSTNETANCDACFLFLQLNFVMILTSNYNNLTRRLYRQRKGYATSAYTPSQPSVSAPPSMPARSVANSSPVVRRSQPPVVVPSQPLNYKSRRSSRDIELDYIIDDATTVDRRREVDSHMGVNYYYKH